MKLALLSSSRLGEANIVGSTQDKGCPLPLQASWTPRPHGLLFEVAFGTSLPCQVLLGLVNLARAWVCSLSARLTSMLTVDLGLLAHPAAEARRDTRFYHTSSPPLSFGIRPGAVMRSEPVKGGFGV